MQRAAGLEPVRVGGDSAHGMQRDRSAAHGFMAPPSPVGPWHRDLDFFVECGMGHLGGEPPDGCSRNAASVGDGLRCIAWVEIALGDELKDWNTTPAIG